MDEKQRFQQQQQQARVLPRPASPSPAPPKRGNGKVRQFVAAFIVNLLPFCFGTAVGWTSPMTEVLKAKETSPLGEPLTKEEISWLGSLLFIGGIVGTLFWGRVADAWGRKSAGYATAVPFIVGWTLILISRNLKVLYAARFMLGMGGSGGFIVPPLYVGDMVHDSVRGTLGSFVILFLNTGVVFAYVLGEVASYKIFSMVCLTVPFVFLMSFFFLPESPVWLWSRKRRQDAERSLEWFRGGNLKLVQEETSRYSIPDKKESVGVRSLFSSRGAVRGMAIGLSLFCWQQMCGILVILTFASDMITSSGSSISSGLATIAVGAAQLGASFLSSLFADKVKRRLLLLFSYSMMGLSLFVVGLYLTIGKSWNMGWIPSAALVVHVVTYALGAGPVPYIVICETVAPSTRGLATSIFVMWGTSLAFASVKIYPFLVTKLGMAGCYWFFAAWCAAGFAFTLVLVPETKDVPLSAVLAKLNGEKHNDLESSPHS